LRDFEQLASRAGPGTATEDVVAGSWTAAGAFVLAYAVGAFAAGIGRFAASAGKVLAKIEKATAQAAAAAALEAIRIVTTPPPRPDGARATPRSTIFVPQ
jgi:hypothetical protein